MATDTLQHPADASESEVAVWRVLVCEDEKNMRRLLQDVLTEERWEVEVAASAEEALTRLTGSTRFSALVLDLSLPGMNGLELMRQMRHRGIDISVVVITAFATVEVAVKAMQAGAVDFLVKPFDNARIKAALRKIQETRDLLREAEMSQPQLDAGFTGAANAPIDIIGNDTRLTGIFRMIKQVASTRTCVLIQGESGTGKELVAQAIHYHGNRRDKPFVPLNCAALPETLLESEFFGHERGSFTGAYALQRGRFELADGGTLFLDEAGEMPLSLQVKLLRVLQEGRFTRVGGEKEISVDVRVIAATNRDLQDAIAKKTFREDLFYRLNVIPIHLPPLRERRSDIPQLLNFFINRFARRHKLPRIHPDPDTMEVLNRYSWPGNIRELQNCVEKAIVLQDPKAMIPPAALAPATVAFSMPGEAGSQPAPNPHGDLFPLQLGESGSVRPLSDVAADAQRAAVIRALRITNGNKSEASKLLDVSYKTLFNKIHELDIQIQTRVE